MSELLKAIGDQAPQLIFLLIIVVSAAVALREFRSIRRELGDDIRLQVKAEVGALLSDIKVQSDEAQSRLRTQLTEASKIHAELRQERTDVEEQMKYAKEEMASFVSEMRGERERLKDLVPRKEEMDWISPRDLVARANAAVTWQEAYENLALIDEDNATSKDLELAGDICRRSRFFAKAIYFYQRAVDKDPENLSAEVERLALTAEMRHAEREGSLIQLRKIVIENRRDTRLLSRYFNVLINLGRYEAMAEFCSQQLADEDLSLATRVRLHRNLAVAYNNLDRSDEAVAELRRALRLAPDDEDALKSYAFLLRDQGRFEEAAECYERLLMIDPLEAHYLQGLAYVREREGRLENAEALLGAARDLSSGADLVTIEGQLRRVLAKKEMSFVPERERAGSEVDVIGSES